LSRDEKSPNQFLLQLWIRKDTDRVFTVFAAQVMGWQHGTCHHFVALSLQEGAFLFQLPLDKLAFLAKLEIRLKLEVEYWSFLQIRLEFELPSFRSNSSN